MTPDAGFWAGRRVLVTGHTGDGAWACLWLQRLGAAVTGLSLPPARFPNLHESLWPRTGLEDIIADLRDPLATAAALQVARPDVILHLAGCWDRDEAERSPARAFATNVMGTAHLLETAGPLTPAVTLVALGDDELATPLGASMAARAAVVAAWQPRWRGTLATVRRGDGPVLDRIAGYLLGVQALAGPRDTAPPAVVDATASPEAGRARALAEIDRWESR